MKKHVFILVFLFAAIQIFSQVGINTTEPKATLDIVGKPSESNVLDGLIVPRITAIQLKAKNYSSEQKGALIYVTENFTDSAQATEQVEFVKSVGLYEFDGNRWKRAGNTEDTLYDVVKRGNFAGRFISFTGDSISKEETRTAAIGFNSSTNSYFFGNMNPSHTGLNNIGIGLNALENLTSGNGTVAIGNNAFKSSTETVGTLENEYNVGVGFNVGSLFKGDHSVALGFSALNSNWMGEQNTAIGQQAMSEGIGTEKVSYNTAIGSNALRLANQPFGNIVIGRSAGVRMSGKNNVIIGNWTASSELYSRSFNGNNKLMIHSHAFDGAGNLANTVGTNTLIYGDFEERWFRINGKFQINPSYINVADSSYSKLVLYNSVTGNVGTTDFISIPTPPTTGNYVLKTISGTLQWVAE
ncbi:hypothetical protein [Chryseobacterium sp.]|uniref:hypothetical protein n=1 Tax=Chryseobacterium sp. TaxID=1871047 RepID=UPI00289F44FB|nr:hypothetical protein [Chryseobacterium sp.]